jgi:glucan biosynthesis protein C
MNKQSRMVGAPRGADPPLSAAENRARDGARAAATSLALDNMRGLLILILLAFHSVLAYLGFLRSDTFAFNDPPYGWRAFPIIDSQRWFGFDIFCAWVDVYLMALMFFLSALFTWPSLARKGAARFLGDRLLRLGVPFVFGLIVIAPFALYPAYRLTAVDASASAYVSHFLALPFWPNGPAWFLWLLAAFTILAVALRRFAPRSMVFLGALAARATNRPGRYFVGLAAAAAIAYVPLAVAYTPWTWAESGPFSLQLSRPLLYGVYYFAGLGVGAHGLERGLLAVDGALARRWRLWFVGSLACLGLWMGLTASTFPDASSAPLILQIGADASFALAGASGCFFMIAASLRFGGVRSPIVISLTRNAFGIYLIHYVFVVWLQYALLAAPLFAFLKAAIVFGGALALSWGATAAIRFTRVGARLIGEAPRPRHGPDRGYDFARRAPQPAAARQRGDERRHGFDSAVQAIRPGEQEPIC